jgi:hypothetical protein
VIDLKNKYKVTTLTIAGLTPPAPPKTAAKPTFPGAKRVELAAAEVKAEDGKITFAVDLELPEGWKINADGPMAYLVEAAGDSGPVDRSAIGKLVRPKDREARFNITVPLRADAGEDKVTLSLTYYYCETKAEGICKVGSVIWTIPLKITSGAKSAAVDLPHRVE